MKTWTWIDMFKVDAKIYEKAGSKPTVIDKKLLKSMFDNFVYSRKKNYSVPFLRDHARKDSYIYGDIHNLRIKNGYVQALVTMTREEERQAYESGIMREFSPGFDLSWFDPHTGEERGPALLELSYTGTAYQRNLRPPSKQLSKQVSETIIGLSRGIITHGEPVMARKKAFSQEEKEETVELAINAPEEALIQMSEEEEDEKELSEFSLNDIGAMMTEILGYLRPAKEEMSSEEEEEKELSQDEEDKEELSQDEEEDEKKALHRKVKSLEDDYTRLQLSQRGITGSDADNLIKLSRVDKDLYQSTVKLYSRQGKQSPIGVVGLDTTGGSVTATEVAKAAKAAGVDGPKLRLFLSREYPEFGGNLEANEVRKALKRL